MADATVKMGVSGIAQFKQGMQQAQTSVKSLDAALKLNEKQLKATGDAEGYMQQKASLLQQKLEAQKRAVKEAEGALKAMRENGVDQTSQAYQKMQTALLNAQSAVLDTQADMQGLSGATEEAGKQTDKLSQQLGGLNKKVSLEQVKSAVNSISSGIENAAKKAADLGKAIFDDVMNAARAADDNATMALMYGVPLERFLQMQGLVQSGMDTSVDAILGAMSKMKNGVGKESKATMEAMEELGVSLYESVGKEGGGHRDPDEVFWDVGRAIMNLGDAYERESKAQAIFGRGWKELVPLFTEFTNQQEFNEALENVTTISEEENNALAELSDAMGKLEHDFEQVKTKVESKLAPALTAAADALSGLLGNIMDYLETPEGKQALEDMSKAVSGLFEDLGKIDPEQVVAGFSKVFQDIVGGFQWLEKNKETLKGVLGAILGAWAVTKAGGTITTVLQLIEGLKGLQGGSLGGGGGSAAHKATRAAARTASDASKIGWGTAALGAAKAAIPNALLGWGAHEAFKALGTNALSGVYTYEDKLFEELGKKTGLDTMGEAEKLLSDNPEYGKRALGYMAGYLFGGKRSGNKLTPDKNYFPFVQEDYSSEYRQYMMSEGQIEAVQRFWDAWRELAQKQESTEPVDLDKAIEDFGTAYDKFEAAFSGDKNLFTYVDTLLTGLMERLETKDLPEDLSEDLFTLPAVPELTDDAGEKTQAQLNALGLRLPVMVDMIMPDGHEYANGLPTVPTVPFDGWPAILHKGEQVVPAREVSARSYSSNLYVENMVMNSGADAEGLAAAMAAAQRRTLSGYGS